MTNTYRKKPVEIQAVRFEKPYKQVQEFCPNITLIKMGMQEGMGLALGQIDRVLSNL